MEDVDWSSAFAGSENCVGRKTAGDSDESFSEEILGFGRWFEITVRRITGGEEEEMGKGGTFIGEP